MPMAVGIPHRDIDRTKDWDEALWTNLFYGMRSTGAGLGRLSSSKALHRGAAEGRRYGEVRPGFDGESYRYLCCSAPTKSWGA